MNISFKEIFVSSNKTFANVRAENGNVLRISGSKRLAAKLEKAWEGLIDFNDFWTSAINCKASITFNSY